MTLSEHQQEFALHIGYLLQHIDAAGYACTFGDAYRSPRAFGGMGEKGPYGRYTSAHKQRLAVDLNLFKNGRWITERGPFEQFGAYWKAMHILNRWGGDFDFDGDGIGDDANHFSRWYGGIA